jgi:hypothetical protein
MKNNRVPDIISSVSGVAVAGEMGHRASLLQVSEVLC